MNYDTPKLTFMWSWTKLSSIKWEDSWTERIGANPNAVIEKIKGGKTIRITVYSETETEAVILKDYLGGSVRELKTHDWVAAQAKANNPPLRIRHNLLITDQTDENKLEQLQQQFPSRAILTIPAEMAFGTGDHATTSTCLRLISDFATTHRGQEWYITDIGCGTAVLSMAALLLGATHATAFDFDAIAVGIAQSNAQRNGFSTNQLDLFHGDVFDWEPTTKQQGNLVVANLFSTILQKAFPRIISTMLPDAQLIISGILAPQWDETRLVAEKCGLTFEQVIKKGKWVTARGHLLKK
ncbi:MAG: 50S ribosomal protein L11 methyltransferase [Akkermansia sp.]